jgi:hypothetical protein
MRTRSARLGAASLVVGMIAVLAGCSGSSPTGSAAPPSGRSPTTTIPPTTTTTTVPPTTTTTVPPTTTTTVEPAQPGWAPVSTVGGKIAIDQQSFTGPAGGQVTVFRFRAGRVSFRLHDGSSDPPGGSAIPGAGPTIAADEAPLLLAAFNGGFNSSTDVGGFEVSSQVLVPLVAGMASFVIDADGNARVGVWGSDVPVAGEAVVSVRQNLPPLVVGGQPSPNIGDVSAWGATLGGGTTVARSALGEDAQGNILYAGGISLQPSDLAAALVNSGAVTAMELDINPEWVQLDWAAAPGGPLSAGIPGQNRPADQYQEGWTRDFVTVLATG